MVTLRGVGYPCLRDGGLEVGIAVASKRGKNFWTKKLGRLTKL